MAGDHFMALETNTWGPAEVERVTPMGGWSNPTKE